MKNKWIETRLSELDGKNQSGLAAAIGGSPARVTEIKKGTREVKISEAYILADYLEMSLPDILALLSGRPCPPRSSVRQKIDDTLNQVDQADESKVLGILEGYLVGSGKQLKR